LHRDSYPTSFMNYIPADNGEMVIAEGAPASVARVRVQFPVLIDKIRTARNRGANETDAQFMCASAGITGKLERDAIMSVVQPPVATQSIEFHL